MNINFLYNQIKAKQSFLCIGLDTDLNKIPKFLLNTKDPIFAFNKTIIDCTANFAIAYKPNIAFYESEGQKGWESLEKTAWYIKQTYPEIFLIADAKRGDIGNTSEQYAKAFFKNLPFDAITVSPYMGSDSIKPFLNYENKFVIILTLTTNEGAYDFQFFQNKDNEYLFEYVLKKSLTWANNEKIMFVVGATKANMIEKVRKIVPDHFLLVPGIGSQGGDLEEVAKYGFNKFCGLIVNSSRAIIYASNDENFEQKTTEATKQLQDQMRKLLIKYKIL